MKQGILQGRKCPLYWPGDCCQPQVFIETWTRAGMAVDSNFNLLSCLARAVSNYCTGLCDFQISLEWKFDQNRPKKTDFCLEKINRPQETQWLGNPSRPLLKSQRAESAPQEEVRRIIVPTAPSGKFLPNLQTDSMSIWMPPGLFAVNLQSTWFPPLPCAYLVSAVWAQAQQIP